MARFLLNGAVFSLAIFTVVEPSWTCESYLNCPEGLECIDGVCKRRRDSCSTDAQCTLHKMCINNRCVRGTGTGIRCSKDDSCPQMAACKFHECACHSSRQCPWSEFCDHGTCRRLTKKNCHWFKSKSCSKGQKCVFGTCHTPDQDSPCELHSDCTASIFQECFKGKCVISWSFFWFRWFIPLYLFIWVLLFSAVFMCRRAFRMLRKAPLVQKAPKNGHACDYC